MLNASYRPKGNLTKAIAPTYCATKAALHSYTKSLRFQLRDTGIQVVEIIPPRVQTAIQDGLAPDPHTMALEDFVAATMAQLQTRPQATEIVVDQAQPCRLAARADSYDRLYAVINPDA